MLVMMWSSWWVVSMLMSVRADSEGNDGSDDEQFMVECWRDDESDGKQ